MKFINILAISFLYFGYNYKKRAMQSQNEAQLYTSSKVYSQKLIGYIDSRIKIIKIRWGRYLMYHPNQDSYFIDTFTSLLDLSYCISQLFQKINKFTATNLFAFAPEPVLQYIQQKIRMFQTIETIICICRNRFINMINQQEYLKSLVEDSFRQLWKPDLDYIYLRTNSYLMKIVSPHLDYFVGQTLSILETGRQCMEEFRLLNMNIAESWIRRVQLYQNYNLRNTWDLVSCFLNDHQNATTLYQQYKRQRNHTLRQDALQKINNSLKANDLLCDFGNLMLIFQKKYTRAYLTKCKINLHNLPHFKNPN